MGDKSVGVGKVSAKRFFIIENLTLLSAESV
jgi:hypothetical protein